MRLNNLLLASAVPAALAGRVHAETDPIRIVQSLHTAFDEFKQRQDERVAALEAEIERVQASASATRLNGGGSPHGARFSSEVQQQILAMVRGQPMAAMSTQSDPDGGFFVIPELDSTIGSFVRNFSPMRQLASVVTLKTPTNEWNKVIATQGGQSGWVGEEDARGTTVAPVFGNVSIPLHEVYACPELTNRTLEDSAFNVTDFITGDVSEEFAVREGAAFATGDGIKKPLGFLASKTSAAADDTRPFGTIQYLGTGTSGAFPASNPGDKLKDLVALLKAGYRIGDGVAWMMNSATANTISKFKDGQGNYLWTQSVLVGQPDRLLGYPVAINEDMPDIAANSFAVAFGNFKKGYAIIDRPGVRLVRDNVTRKGFTSLYFYKRTGGGVLDSRAIKLLKFA